MWGVVLIKLKRGCGMSSSDKVRMNTHEEGYLWEVLDGKSKVYLFGTVHIIDESFFPLKEEILSAFNQCQNLVCEIHIDDKDIENIKVNNQMVYNRDYIYPDGDSLYNHYPSKNIINLKKQLEKTGLCSEDILYRLHKLKPEAINALLVQIKLKQMGMDQERIGIDYYLTKEAKKSGKVILELEDKNEQKKMLEEMGWSLNGREKNDQSINFKKAKRINSKFITYIGKMYVKGLTSAYTTGNIIDIGNKIPKEAPIIRDRNEKMCGKIKGLLRMEGGFFIAVGAMHIAGKGSIVELLRKEGYTLKKIL